MQDVHSDKGSEYSDSPSDNKMDMDMDAGMGMDMGMGKETQMKMGTPEADTKDSCVVTPAHATIVRSGARSSPVATVKATLFTQDPSPLADRAYDAAPALFITSFLLLLLLKVSGPEALHRPPYYPRTYPRTLSLP